MEALRGHIETPEHPPVHLVLLPEYICIDDDADDDEAIDNEFVLYLKRKRLWGPLVRTIKFFVHFLVVMGLLFGGAVFLAEFEDPVSSLTLPTMNKSERTKSMCQHLEKELSLKVTPETLSKLIKEVKLFQEEEKEIVYREQHQERKFVIFKWFYFVTVTSTTIGYGDLSPKTDRGKLFTIGFAVIGVILMTTLIYSFGTIISACNKKFHAFVITCICRNSRVVSEQLMSVISISLLFFIFLFFIIWYGQYGMKYSDWSLVDAIYYWIITFTTIGYGDLTYSFDIEIQYFFEHVVYRIVGLGFLAAIIDSISVYGEYRKELLLRKRKLLKKTLSKGVTGFCDEDYLRREFHSPRISSRLL